MNKMKRNLTLMTAALLLTGTLALAQIEMPAPSPLATFSQKVGLTDVEIVYSRPSMRGRVVYGDLVPWGKLWRTGANMATKVTFSDDVKIGGKDLKAGTYALFTIPGKDEWTVIFNTRAVQAGAGQYKETEDALRVSVKPENLSHSVETFTITIDDVTNTSAAIVIIWEKTRVKVPMEVNVDQRVMASIDRALQVDPNNYFMAATYYHESGKDLNQALTWINQALAEHEKAGRNVFWIYRRKSLIQADLKQYKDAVATAQKSLEQAKAANNDDYVKMNTESIAQWSKMK